MKKNSNYKYVILVACFLLMAFPFSIINTIHTLFITPVTAYYHFRLSEFSLLFSICAITIAIVSPIIGKLMTQIPLRLLMTICSIFVSIGFYNYSFCHKIYHFYLNGIFVSIGLCGITMLPVSTVLTNWFQDRKATALGIAFAGTGTGTLFFMQLVSRLLSTIGFISTYKVLGLILFFTCVPISLFLIRLQPSDDLLYHTRKKSPKPNISENEESRPTRMETLHSPVYLLFLCGLALLGFVISGIKVHVQPFLDLSGYAITFNANVGSCLAISALIGNLIGGFLFDRLHLNYIIYLYGFLHLVSVICLIFLHGVFLPYLFAIVFGFALSFPSLFPSYGVSYLFPYNNYSTTLGFSNAFFTIGGSLGPFITGIFADQTYGYPIAWIFYFFVILSYVILLSKSVQKFLEENKL